MLIIQGQEKTAKLSEYPLSRLQDKQDFRQALYELWTNHDPAYLEELTGISTKREQTRALNYYLYEREFAYGKSFSGLTAVLKHRYDEHPKDKTALEKAFTEVFKHYSILKASSTARNGVKMTLKSLLHYKVLTSGNWNNGNYEDRTGELAGYILAFHPEFPEDLSEVTDIKESSVIQLESYWDLAFAVYDLFGESVEGDIPWEERWDSPKGREDFIKEQLTLKNEGKFYFRKPHEPFDLSKALPSASWQVWRLGEDYERHDRIIQEWVSDFLSRLKSTIDQNLPSTIQSLATIDTSKHPDRWPGREGLLKYRKWRFYAALFEEILLKAPDWLTNRWPIKSNLPKMIPQASTKFSESINFRIRGAAQLPLPLIKTNIDLEKAAFSLYLQYSEAGKELMQELKAQHYPTFFESDEEELDYDWEFDLMLVQALTQQRSDALSNNIQDANAEWCADIVHELQRRSINADGLTLAELTGCRWQECEDDKLKDLFSWIVQHPRCMSEFYENLPTPSRLLDKPMTELKDTLDWRQAFYELAFGFNWPSGEEILGELLEFPINQSKAQQEEKLNTLENRYLDRRSKDLDLRKNLNTNELETWIKEFRHTLTLTFERGNTSSLKTLYQKNASSISYLAGDLWRSIIDEPLSFFTLLKGQQYMSKEPKQDSKFRLKLDQPIIGMDDWDILQAAWELATEQISKQIPNFQEQIKLTFPVKQTKQEQITCLENKLQLLFEFSTSTPHKFKTPINILDEALHKIQNLPSWVVSKPPLRTGEISYTPRFFWGEYLSYKTYEKQNDDSYQLTSKGYPYFGTDFWLHIADKKNKGNSLITISFLSTKKPQQMTENAPKSILLPQDCVLFDGRIISLSPNEYEFLKAAYNLVLGENINDKLSIKLDKRGKDKTKNKIAERMQLDKQEIFVPRAHCLQAQMKQNLRWDIGTGP